MSEWVNGSAKHDVQMPGATPDVGLYVSAAVDLQETERPMFILEERPDNQGASLAQPEILSAAVKDVSESLNINPSDADWYMLGKDDELYALEVNEETVLRENPQWQQLANSGDLNIHESDDARQHFPDVEFNEVTAEARPIGDMQSIDLGTAFGGATMENAPQQLNEWQLTEPEWLEAQMPTDFRPTMSHEPDTGLGLDL